ncbi:nuclear transport factor 2 family protein [Streptomyces sp. NPDC059193]|uniref:nuclear transport factor 2 family protein n=1 Tax=Streptomyces sp. NPDC059193 TaxID=3346763 RepID=UPI0036ADCE60
MTTPMNPSELYRHGLQLLRRKDVSAWVDLWDHNGVVEFPFAPENWPSRIEGKTAISDYVHRYPEHIYVPDVPDHPAVEGIPGVAIHPATDPETIVVNMRGGDRLVDDDGTPYIAVITVRAGLFTSYRAYWNPLAATRPSTGSVNVGLFARKPENGS